MFHHRTALDCDYLDIDESLGIEKDVRFIFLSYFGISI